MSVPKDVLWVAYWRCQSNGGSEGVDGQTFEDIEAYGKERWVDELAEELKRKDYRWSAVRRVWIAKANGKQRPLGIPRIRDRVVQMAAVLILGPIFGAARNGNDHAGGSPVAAIVRFGCVAIPDAFGRRLSEAQAQVKVLGAEKVRLDRRASKHWGRSGNEHYSVERLTHMDRVVGY